MKINILPVHEMTKTNKQTKKIHISCIIFIVCVIKLLLLSIHMIVQAMPSLCQRGQCGAVLQSGPHRSGSLGHYHRLAKGCQDLCEDHI